MENIVLFQPLMGYYDKVARDLPAALLSISSYIHDKYNITIIDQRINGWENKLEKSITNEPICFGITAWTGTQIKHALAVSQYVKSKCDVPIVWGGIHASTLPRQTLENENIDFVVEGEGELIFPKLLKCIENDGDFSKLNKIWYKQFGEIKKGTSPFGNEEALDLNSLNKLPYHLLNVNDYKGKGSAHSGRAFLVETGRGCPRRCSYCYNTSFNENSWRTASAEKIIENIIELQKWGNVNEFFFIDDNFFTERKRTKIFVELLKKNNLNIKWGVECEIHMLRRMDYDYLANLEKVGLTSMSIGVETGSKRIVKMLDKTLNLDDVLPVNQNLSKFNFHPMYNFMGGYVTETKKEFRETLGLIVNILEQNKRAHIQGMGMVVPYPGTNYLRQCQEHGLKEPTSLEGWYNYNPEDWINYNPLVSDVERRFFKTLHVSSLFIDRKAFTNITGKSLYGILVRIFFLFYHKIARLRFKHFTGILPIERYIFNIFNLLFVAPKKDGYQRFGVISKGSRSASGGISAVRTPAPPA